MCVCVYKFFMRGIPKRWNLFQLLLINVVAHESRPDEYHTTPFETIKFK